jgi:hypothetical protein
MYYRRDVFERPGCRPSGKVSETVSTGGYLKVCQTVKKTGLAVLPTAKPATMRLYEIALWQQGLGYYDKDAKITVDSQNIALWRSLEFWKGA